MTVLMVLKLPRSVRYTVSLTIWSKLPPAAVATEDAPRAGFEIAFDDFHCLRIEWNLTGKKDQAVRIYCLRIRAYCRGRAIAMDRLFCQHDLRFYLT